MSESISTSISGESSAIETIKLLEDVGFTECEINTFLEAAVSVYNERLKRWKKDDKHATIEGKEQEGDQQEHSGDGAVWPFTASGGSSCSEHCEKKQKR